MHNELGRFIDPYCDFGFKHLFGKEPNRALLIEFLNSIFKGRKVIVDIQYSKVEYKGPGKDYRKTIFDLYCTGSMGEKFIIEMQKARDQNFKDRSIFYTANLIQEQGEGVFADWDYFLPEIYFVAIMNFKFDDSHPDHFIHDVRLMEINSNKEFYPKMSFVFIEMPKFQKSEGQLENELDEWLFILNNLNKSKSIPVSLIGKRIYEQVFKIAEVGNLTPTEMNEYQQSLKIQRDNNSALNYARKEGQEKGREEGREEGKAKERKELITRMKARGMTIVEIAEISGLSISELEALLL
jgi:predicted transposase/invertase (TIGR01784 family)